MSKGWENVEPAPIEFFHAKLLDLFHEWKRSKTEDADISIDGTTLNNLIAKAKIETYTKYRKQNLIKQTIKKPSKKVGEKLQKKADDIKDERIITALLNADIKGLARGEAKAKLNNIVDEILGE